MQDSNEYEQKFILITCNNDYSLYMFITNSCYFHSNEELKKIYHNIQFHFDEYDNLCFSDDYKKYKDYFFTIKVLEK